MRALVRYNSRNDRGTLDWLDPAVAADVEVVARRAARHRVGEPRGRRRRRRVPPRRADRDPVLVRQPARLLRGQRARHAQRRAGGAAPPASSAWSTRRRARSTASARTVPITEDHPLEPQSPYAASKVAADKLIDSYHRSFDLPVTVAAAVQHLRAAPVRARDHPDDRQPGAGRRDAAPRLAAPAPRPHLRRGHRRRLHRRRRGGRRGRRPHAPARHRHRRLDRRPRRARRRAARQELDGRARPGARAPGEERGRAADLEPRARRAS